MAGAHEDDDPGFWPGYVAAVSGLVQGLLIMAMALGISIFAMSRLAARAGSQPAAAGPALAARAEVGGTAAAPGFPDLRVKPPVPAPRLVPPSAPLAEPMRPIRIAFIGDATVTPASSAATVAAAVEARLADGAARWRIDADGDLADPRARRAAYLRVMGVRAILIRVGVPAQAIDLRLRPADAAELGDGAAGDAANLVTITPVTAGEDAQ